MSRASNRSKPSFPQLSTEVPLVLPYPPTAKIESLTELLLEARKRTIEDAFERAKTAQEVIETRVIIPNVPDVFPSFCLCYFGQLDIRGLTSQERRTLLIGGAAECLVRSPAELAFVTWSLDRQWRLGFKSSLRTYAFDKMPASYDHVCSSAGSTSITIAARILLGEVIASFEPKHTHADRMRDVVKFEISMDQTQRLSRILAEMAAGHVPIVKDNREPAIRHPLVRAFCVDLQSLAKRLQILLADDLATRH